LIGGGGTTAPVARATAVVASVEPASTTHTAQSGARRRRSARTAGRTRSLFQAGTMTSACTRRLYHFFSSRRTAATESRYRAWHTAVVSPFGVTTRCASTKRAVAPVQTTSATTRELRATAQEREESAGTWIENADTPASILACVGQE